MLSSIILSFRISFDLFFTKALNSGVYFEGGGVGLCWFSGFLGGSEGGFEIGGFVGVS